MLDLPRYRVPRVSSSALPRTASFQLSSTAYRVFSTRHYRVPRLFNWTRPRTASFQKGTTAYRVCSGTHRLNFGFICVLGSCNADSVYYYTSLLFTGCRLCRRAPTLDDSMICGAEKRMQRSFVALAVQDSSDDILLGI